MVFSSLIFISVFIPTVIVLYPLLRTGLQNYFLLAASLFFYWWGEPGHLWVMLMSILFTHSGGYLIGRAQSRGGKNLAAALGIAANLALLVYFKYAAFIWHILCRGGQSLHIVLPIGISFFVFQGISYIIDVYRAKCRPSDSLVKTALYISMFPQLVAGPIVRYESIAEQINNRQVTFEAYIEGLCRFCFGLGKKVILANQAGALADLAFGTPAEALTLPLAWLGIAAYTLQIYFDFSGYSDMAIGLGRSLGFSFPENFNFPYISKSLTEFWRRWHMSLSSWFKDYLYIPLGGNCKGTPRTSLNLLIVFALTGLWHGANWTFLIWGLWHGLFLMLEKYGRRKNIALPGVLTWAYCLLAVMTGWVIFRSDTLAGAGSYLLAMVNPQGLKLDMLFLSQLNPKTVLLLLCSIPIAAGAFKSLTVRPCISRILALAVLAASYILLVSSTYNPFIYFRF